MRTFRTIFSLTICTFVLAFFSGQNFANAAGNNDRDSRLQRIQQARHRLAAQYAWKVGPWSACSAVKCGTNGTQHRKVQCYKNGTTHVSDYKCQKPKPASVQPCSAPPCTVTTTLPVTTTTMHPTTTTTTLPPTTTTMHPTTTTTTLPPTTTTVPSTTTTLPVTTTTLPSSGSTLFPASSIWYKDISNAPLHPDSASIISWLSANGGWGTGLMKVDLSINLLTMDATTPMLPFKENAGYYSPDCDSLKSFPAPVGGAVENNPGYTCADGGDCHLLVVDSVNKKLYESYQTNVANGQLYSTCGVQWNLNKVYGENMRGEQCTSTDAAGFPIAALLVTADEVAAGSVNHAIRFILPNKEMQRGVYLHPASHAGGPSGPSTAVPYGAHFRLKASVDISKLKPAAQIVAKAMKKYGMFLSDGGNIALTFANDQFTKAKWSQLGLSTQDFTSLKTSDFEMVQEYDGMRINYNGNCVRNPD